VILLRDDLALEGESHVAVLMGNRVEAVEVVIGAMAAGLWIAPVNSHLRPEEIAPIVKQRMIEWWGSVLVFGRKHLAGYKVPRSIDFERELPRHPTGKLLVRSLRDRYWAGRERRI
jgi:acyl-CoA synthetase (AMP-forming)/AMP-acid ligase II